MFSRSARSLGDTVLSKTKVCKTISYKIKNLNIAAIRLLVVLFLMKKSEVTFIIS